MPPTEFVDTPRPPRTVTCDGRLVRPMAAAAWKATFPPANIALRYAVTAVLGVVVWLSTHSVLLTSIVALLAPTAVLLVTRLRMHSAIRSVVGPGRRLTSGYDAEGRFVVDRATGSLDFAAGAARGVTRVDAVTVVRSRSRQPAFVTPSELLTPEDADFLTSTSPNGDAVKGFRAAHPEVTTPLLVTPRVQQATARLMRRALVRHPFLQVAVAVSVLTIAISDHRLRAALVVAVLGIAGVAILELGLVRTGTKALFSEGTVVGAALVHDGLVLHVPGYPSRVGADELRTVRADDDGIVIRTRRQRVHLLPLGVLDAEGTDRLLALHAR